MYVISAERPLDPVIVAILRALHTVSTKLGFDYFLVGATARDVLMTHVFGFETRRATHDVDFAVALEDWNAFENLKNELIATGEFGPAAGRAHLLLFHPQELGNAYPLDLIPFGGVEHARNQIAWPPDMDVVMNVTGYVEAMNSALRVDVGNGLIVPVVSLPGLAVLKLLAWNDRGLSDNKDAQDFFFLLSRYADAGNVERLYGEAFPILEACGFDQKLAGARLLGHDARLMSGEHAREAIVTMMNDPRKHDRLIMHGMRRSVDSGVETMARMLRQFQQGIDPSPS